jgi:nucleosome binding factor SPN SPT16 subunit
MSTGMFILHLGQCLCCGQQTWLLGYEFPLTLTVFAKEKIYFMCSSTKGELILVANVAFLIPVSQNSTST